ncbi:hypothetical protein ONZ45_g11276 [Pleurotus djamor]|nr:hypothetical protein ONZ45_g11276 [Pleurotus djamor]
MTPTPRSIPATAPLAEDPIPGLPKINWTEDLTFRLITELEKPEHCRILFGKQEKKDNTGKDTKIKVFRQITQALFPNTHPKHFKSMESRVRSKVDTYLISHYKVHVKRLRATGDGIRQDDDGETGPQQAILSK